MEKLAYTKNQIMLSAFLFGPIAAIYFLKKNFDLLGDRVKAKITLQYGCLYAILLCLISPQLNIPGISLAINIVLPIYLGQIFEKYQQSLLENSKHSNWRVLGFSLIGLIVIVIVVVSITFFYYDLGIIKD